MASSLASSSLDHISTVSIHVDKKKKKKGKSKKKKDKKEKKQQPSALDGAHSKRTLRKPKFPCKLCKEDHLLKEVLRTVPVSLVYNKSGLKGQNNLCHQPLIIMLMILPQPVTHW